MRTVIKLFVRHLGKQAIFQIKLALFLEKRFEKFFRTKIFVLKMLISAKALLVGLTEKERRNMRSKKCAVFLAVYSKTVTLHL
jgi:hypothetical protein